MVTVVSIGTQLADNLVAVLAPVLDVNEEVVQRCAVIPYEGAGFMQRLGRSKNVWTNDLIQKPGNSLSVSVTRFSA